MPAHPHTRPRLADRGGAQVRLPWWAIALPTLSFAVLLLMMLNPSRAHPTGDPGLGRVLQSIQHSVLHQA
ncbi:hypothetical protein GCM10018793_68670 [Streptomyces sulfonofaciens]|uniref:Uncharacterized protein n=1 Tax=Streptomyces sulfonofaciens TaxID=68272 RepID=A0A919GPX9_9ACTN|nr:hypothetical protein [Streptomyces sulfonofaciens]GHH88562.1 hypothetical protein GCM10018793_68670 [Streptomyces sulfonofaciens]